LKKFVRNRIPLADWLKTLFAGAIFVGFAAFVKFILAANVIIEATVAIVAAAVVYFAALLLLKVINMKELSAIIKSAKSKK